MNFALCDICFASKQQLLCHHPCNLVQNSPRALGRNSDLTVEDSQPYTSHQPQGVHQNQGKGVRISAVILYYCLEV